MIYMLAWLFSFVFAMFNLIEWSVYRYTNDYYYAKRKNGWWAIFWLVLSIIFYYIVDGR